MKKESKEYFIYSHKKKELEIFKGNNENYSK